MIGDSAARDSAPIPALIVATATRWLGAARSPRALVNAGFEVSLFTPRGSLAEKSGYVSKIRYVPDGAMPREWVHALAATVRATSPRLIIPGDDTALRLLQWLVLAPHDGLAPELQAELSALIVISLGNPAYYRDSIEKTLFPNAAEKVGVRVARWSIVRSAAEAEEFAAAVEFPIVLKRSVSWASSGVRICRNGVELGAAFTELVEAAKHDFALHGPEGLLAQAYVQGATRFYTCVSWKGALVAGYAGEILVWSEPGRGVPTVNRYYRDDNLRAATARLIAGFGISGFIAVEFIAGSGNEEPFAIEINRRLVGGSHRGAPMRVDHWSALRSVLSGTAITTRTDLEPNEEHVCVNFPQEWLRDPESRWLREYPVDVPWDEPKLIEAMLQLRKES
jgi:hypothetical protein